MLVEKYISHVESCIEKALRCESKCSPEILSMEGMSGRYTRHFYNNLLNIDDARYLEIGAYKGSSTCSAMYENKAIISVVDNWSEFGGPREECINNIVKYAKNINDVFVVDCDSFQTEIPNGLGHQGKFNIYMYDGCHKRESHEKALTHYYDVLDDVVIFVVDDWNWDFVRAGTYDGIHKMGFDIKYEKSFHTQVNGTSSTWWNGIGIFVLEKKN